MQLYKSSLRTRAWMGASVFALGALAAGGPVLAQTTGVAAPSSAQNTATGTTTGGNSGVTTVGEIVVTGQRASLRSAEKIKKNSTQLVDSITATDIGALPDRSVVEAIQRIPGVTITRTPDPRDTQRVSVEGSGVQVDGVNYVASEFNGRDAFSAKNGRALSFDDVPSELLAGVDIYKNPSADMIEGGQSIVNLRTRLPFDQPGHLIAYDFSESYGDLANSYQPSGSVLLSDRWDTPIGEFGALIDLSDSNYEERTDTLSIDPYYALDASTGYSAITTSAPAAAGDKIVYVPGGAGYRTLDFNRERQGIDVATQWKPNSDLLVTAQFLRSAAYSTENEHAVGVDPDPGFPSANSSDVFNSKGRFVSGTLASSPGGTTDNFDVLDERYNTTHSVTSDYSLNIKWNPTDKLAFSADVQYIDSSTKSVDFTLFDLPVPSYLDNGVNTNQGPLTLNLNGKLPYIGIPANSALNNPANYFWDAAMDYHDHNDGDEWAERADGTYTFDSDWLSTFRFGIRHTEQDVVTRETPYNWGEVTYSWAGGGLALLNQTNATSPGTNTLPAALMPFSNFFGGAAHLPGTYYAGVASLMQNFTASAAAIQKAEGVGNCCGWTPFSGNYNEYTAGGGGGGTNTQSQETWAGYLTLDFKHDLGFEGSTIPVDGNFGVRIVSTDARGAGAENFVGCSGVCTGLSSSVQTFETTTASTISGGRSYVDALPSLNLRFKFKPDLFLRMAVAESIVRPDFTQMQPTITISHTNGYLYGSSTICQTTAPTGAAPAGGYVPNCLAGTYPFTAYEGNPDLKPTRAYTYDASLEWYFSSTGSLTGTVFFKDIYDFITDAATVQNLTNNGVTEPVLVNQSVDEGHGTIKGAEIAYQQYFDFLPGPLKGLGVQANYTYVESHGAKNASPDPYDPTQIAGATEPNLPLQGLSRDSYNLAVLYDYGPVSARLAYNWRSQYLMTPSAANINIPAYAADYGQLDASAFYTISPKVKIGFQATNLGGAIYRTIVQNEAGLTGNTWVDSDRRFVFVLRGQF